MDRKGDPYGLCIKYVTVCIGGRDIRRRGIIQPEEGAKIIGLTRMALV